MDSSQNCPRSLDFHPSCGHNRCQQCTGQCVMLYNVGPRGTVAIVGKQLLDQLPMVDGVNIRSRHYGNATFEQFNREKVEKGYGKGF